MKRAPVIAYLILVVALLAAFARTEDGRQDSLADVARADVEICEENNRQDAIITALLKAADISRKLDTSRPALTKKEKMLLRDSLEAVEQQNCENLPSVSRAAP